MHTRDAGGTNQLGTKVATRWGSTRPSMRKYPFGAPGGRTERVLLHFRALLGVALLPGGSNAYEVGSTTSPWVFKGAHLRMTASQTITGPLGRPPGATWITAASPYPQEIQA